MYVSLNDVDVVPNPVLAVELGTIEFVRVEFVDCVSGSVCETVEADVCVLEAIVSDVSPLVDAFISLFLMAELPYDVLSETVKDDPELDKDELLDVVLAYDIVVE